MAAQPSRLLKAWHRGGPGLAFRVALDRVADAILERRMHIRSSGLVPIESLVEQWAGCHDYFPSSIRAFSQVLRDLQVSEEDVFVDYGCGMGRAIVLASRLPFRQLIGFDVSARLLEAARANVERAVPHAAQDRITLLHCDARAFRLPETASVLYLYNPFHGDILRAVLADIERSLTLRPRPLKILFNNPSHFGLVERQYGWLHRRKEYSFEHPIVLYEATTASAVADT